MENKERSAVIKIHHFMQRIRNTLSDGGQSRLVGLLVAAALFLLPGSAALAQPPAGEEVQVAQPYDALAAEGEVIARPELVEDLVDQVLRLVGLPAAGNTPAHFGVAFALLILALVLRRVVVAVLFRILQRGARRTSFEFDDHVLPALEGTVKTLVLLIGSVGALMVLKLPPAAERALQWGYVLAFSLITLVFFLKLAGAILDHLQERARSRQLDVVPFMPWIRRIVIAVVFVFGVLMIAQSMGANVGAFLAGLGIGGLAVALAAQDTLANIFGSIVIAIDQPFRLGEFVQIGGNSGSVEDIGLRSTRLRTAQKNLITIPNKTVAAEAISNLTRFSQRRAEQTFRLNYESTPEQMAALVEDIRGIVLGEEDVDKSSVIVQFTELGASSLDIWLAYNSLGPDFVKFLQLKQRINLRIMRAVRARGMAFAYPTQSIHLASWPEGTSRPVAERPSAPAQD